jgi:hypothetical protein
MSEKECFEESASFHDNLIYAVRLDPADPDTGDWQSRLCFDIDHIVEWICGIDGRARFRVAPATLAFHDVTDLRIGVDFGGSGYPQSINELSIDRIEREPVTPEGGAGPRPYYRWRIRLNLPAGGEIAFAASGYALSLRAEPVLLDEQRLPPKQRPPGL